MIDIDLSKHASIYGETQSGKTLLANYLFERTGGLFVDIEDKGDIIAERTLTRRNTKKHFIEVVKRYNKIRYIPSPEDEKAVKEAKWLWKTLSKLNLDLYVYVDETQHYGTARKNAFDVFATRGLKHGLHLVSIAQRPAMISKNIATQSMTSIFFDISTFEKTYFDRYQLPYDEIKDKLEKQPLYYFVVYKRGIGVSDPYKLKGIK